MFKRVTRALAPLLLAAIVALGAPLPGAHGVGPLDAQHLLCPSACGSGGGG